MIFIGWIRVLYLYFSRAHRQFVCMFYIILALRCSLYIENTSYIGESAMWYVKCKLQLSELYQDAVRLQLFDSNSHPSVSAQPKSNIQYISRNMHTVFALLCFVMAIHWLISPYPSGLLHWHCGNLTIAPVPAKQPWWIWINTSCEFIMNDCITTTKQSTTKPCAYFLGYIVYIWPEPGMNPFRQRPHVGWI